jgi:hypothetical protein
VSTDFTEDTEEEGNEKFSPNHFPNFPTYTAETQTQEEKKSYPEIRGKKIYDFLRRRAQRGHGKVQRIGILDGS